MRVFKNITELIGNTPLIELSNYAKSEDIGATLLAKAECFNPAGSAKDRVALAMIRDAEKKGLITKHSTIIEPTSGNTGIGLAAVAGACGYNVLLTMPDTMSVERQKLLKAYGAEIVLTDGKLGMAGAVQRAEELHKQIKGSFLAGQFYNPVNPLVHYETTGPEIWADTDKKVDVFVAGVGTGGTLSGVGKFLKEQNPDVRIVAVEPFDSPLLSEGKAAAHGIQGIGANFIPDNLDKTVIDEIITVKTEDAYKAGCFLAQHEGLLVGISSGAAAFAAKELAKRPENEGKVIVVLLPDTGERYLSTQMFE